MFRRVRVQTGPSFAQMNDDDDELTCIAEIPASTSHPPQTSTSIHPTEVIVVPSPNAMTTARPVGCLCNASSKPLLRPLPSRQLIATSSSPLSFRRYAQQPAFRKPDKPADPVKSALTITESRTEKADPINPARSTLPPPLNLPTRGTEAAPVYWFRLGRAYGTFYKDGIKAVWYNYKAANLLKNRIRQEHGAKDVTDAVGRGVLTRSDFQLLARNSHDIGKLPIFGLMVLVFGEWLVLIVPFVPNRVPGTCRIPKQVEGMRQKAEERRRFGFRRGITEPSKEQLSGVSASTPAEKKDGKQAWPVAFSTDMVRRMLGNLRDDQLYHLSSTLGLHSRIWDRIQLAPPSSLLRRAIGKRLQYLAQDDYLLLRGGGAARLTPEELHIACEQRGIDILGKREDVLRQDLSWWLKRQQEDKGVGRALLVMLFRRPNAWKVGSTNDP